MADFDEVKDTSAASLSSRKRQDEETWSYYELEKCLQFIKDHRNVSAHVIPRVVT